MNWNEFLERYLINHEEFHLKYRDYEIDLLYSPDGERFAYYISTHSGNETWFQRVRNRNRYLEFEEFDTPNELLDNFTIFGNSLKDIWDELEW